MLDPRGSPIRRTRVLSFWFQPLTCNFRNRSWDRLHLPRYVAPHGRRYHPVCRGYRLKPSFVTQQYWFKPFEYNLSPAYGSYRLVRYFNDALLVDSSTGEVVDIIPNLF